MDADWLLDALASWGRPMEVVDRLAGGLNSTTWLVRATFADGQREYVAKLADTDDIDAFLSGLRVAVYAAAHGFPSGPPLPTPDGEVAVTLSEGVLALLEYVPGTPPEESSESDLRRVGSTIARAHLSLRDGTANLSEQFTWPWGWASACLQGIPMPARVRTAAASVLAESRRTVERVSMRVGVVHGDPGLDSFRLSEQSPRLDGLIDWSATMEAPALYDLASFAVMTRHDPRLLSRCVHGYRAVSPELDGELDHLGTIVKLRWMCNAIYFSARIARGIVRGVSSEADNRRGLAEAYRGMTGEQLGKAEGR